ncbi:MAG TPA: 3-oxoacyl-ACP synthase, partial [Terricaulis sp.]|nr:3-oxoacyl-ACP synthase [Terricaulis sp.]
MGGLRDGYITGAGAFLPGPVIGNDQMEDHLGRIAGRDSLFGKKALRWNGVEGRHYAMAPDGAVSHSNAEMCALAVRAALEAAGLEPRDLGLLAAATTQGDLL